jgi:AcrR family transcriptional regulator
MWPQGSKRRAGADRRQAIINTAITQLVAEGFEGLRIRDVAALVGVNQATLL